MDEKFEKLNLDHLNIDQRKEVLKILQKNKEVFSDRPGLCDPAIAEHVITVKMKEEDWPKQKKPYQVPPILRPEIERQIQELLRDGMIEPSASPIAHPIVCVMKSDKTVRMCCDNRFINSICVSDRQPMRRVNDILDQVGAATYISAFDASSGYWQIGVQEESRLYTAFVFDQSYQWKRLNFGLKNAAATYQRAIEKILAPHSKYATAYIDDVSVYSMTWKEHLRHMDDVLQTILRLGFKLRLSKCKFAQRKIKLLGQIVGKRTRQLDPEKVRAVLEIKPPTTKKEIQQFIGILSYYRIFIPNMSELSYCLTELTKGKKNKDLKLNDEQLKAFEDLKKALATAAVLTTPVFDGKTPFVIQADLSAHSVEACLAQEQPDGTERPIAFASSKLTATQRNWSTIEREGYAVIFALRKFETYLIGAPIFIYTDHNPLQYIVDCSPKSAGVDPVGTQSSEIQHFIRPTQAWNRQRKRRRVVSVVNQQQCCRRSREITSNQSQAITCRLG